MSASTTPAKSLGVPTPLEGAAPSGYDGVIAFYYPDKEEDWDKHCKCAFLGNFWPVGPGKLKINVPSWGRERAFSNAEAAFQALKYPSYVDSFEDLSGSQAYRLRNQLKGQEDSRHSGLGDNFDAMLHVVEKKFSDESLANRLKQTGNAFLVEHCSVPGRDKVWSNNHFGDGQNLLGLQLMMVRDRKTGICRHQRHTSSEGEWQTAVKVATEAVLQHFGQGGGFASASQASPAALRSSSVTPTFAGGFPDRQRSPSPVLAGYSKGTGSSLRPTSPQCDLLTSSGGPGAHAQVPVRSERQRSPSPIYEATGRLQQKSAGHCLLSSPTYNHPSNSSRQSYYQSNKAQSSNLHSQPWR